VHDSRGSGNVSEELWYPEFRLKKNPFVFADRRQETIKKETYEIVETEAIKLIKGQNIFNGRVIIDGPKGCGKSTTLRYMESYGFKVPTIVVIGSVSMTELVFELLNKIMNDDELDSKEILSSCDNSLTKSMLGFYTAWLPHDSNYPSKYVCRFNRCYMKGCEFPTFNNDVTFRKFVYHVNNEIRAKDVWCPLAEWLVVKWFEMASKLEKLNGLVFMFDVPDEVGNDQPSKYFKNFISSLGDASKANMILMATRKQFLSLIKHDFFQRWNNDKFLMMTKQELKIMCEERLRGVCINPESMQNPISDESWDYIAVGGAFNPRNVIWSANTVISAMIKEHRSEVAGVDYVKKALLGAGRSGYVNAADALEAVLKDLRDNKRTWVGAKEICELMNNVMKIDVSIVSLGKMMAPMHFDKKKPDSGTEYRIG
jgi:hypothetical protein